VTAFGGGCRSLMISSALAQEGKSTTAANLAIALARTGRHVVLVDLDLRRPSLDRFFALRSKPGITDLVFGRTSIGDAGLRLTFGGATEPPFSRDLRLLREGDSEQSPEESEPGILDVIGSGTLPPNPGEFMVTSELDAILKELQSRADLLIVDGPPLLLAGEALTLSSKVDALLLVARMNAFRWGQVKELERVLVSAPTLKLGMIATSHVGLHRRAYYGSAPMPARDDLTSRVRPARPLAAGEDGGAAATSVTGMPDQSEAEPDQSAVSGRRSWT
jgi:succinoglycan biosynthesis transport protein ExoP